MKNIYLLLLTIFVFSSCVTNNYFEVFSDGETRIYSDADSLNSAPIIVPSGSPIFINYRKTKRGYTRVKYGKYYGWSYKPRYKAIRQSSTNTGSYNYTPSGGTVQVKGYYRKDGTYVRPHTRSAPRRR